MTADTEALRERLTVVRHYLHDYCGHAADCSQRRGLGYSSECCAFGKAWAEINLLLESKPAAPADPWQALGMAVDAVLARHPIDECLVHESSMEALRAARAATVPK